MVTKHEDNKTQELHIDIKSSKNDITFLLNNLNIKRCSKYDDWIKLGMGLKH